MLHIIFYIHFIKFLKRLYLKRQSEPSEICPDTSNLVIILMFKIASDQQFFFKLQKLFQKQVLSYNTYFQSNFKIRDVINLWRGAWDVGTLSYS